MIHVSYIRTCRQGYGHVPGTGSLSLGRKDSLSRRPSLSRTSSGAAGGPEKHRIFGGGKIDVTFSRSKFSIYVCVYLCTATWIHVRRCIFRIRMDGLQTYTSSFFWWLYLYHTKQFNFFALECLTCIDPHKECPTRRLGWKDSFNRNSP